MTCFMKTQSENVKMTWNIRLFIFCMICNFPKCDGFTGLYIISIKEYGIKFLFPLLCNYGNLTLKLHQKISCLNEGWLFIVRLKVGSLPIMMNKEVLIQFIYKPT